MAIALAAFLSFGSLFSTPIPTAAVSTTLVISQFQVVDNTPTDEFIELHNVGSSSIDLNGYRVVRRLDFGSDDLTLVSWSSSTVVPAGGYYLIANISGYNSDVTPDITYTFGSADPLSPNGGGIAIRIGDQNTGEVVDSVGYGSATNSFVETAVVTAPSPGSTRQRKASVTTAAAGCVDSDNNFDDFESPSSVTPRNSETAPALCSESDTAPTVTSTVPDDDATGIAISADISVTFSEAVVAGANSFTIGCTTSGAHTFALSGGSTTFTLDPDTDFANGEICTVTVVAAEVTDGDTSDPPDTMSNDYTFDFTTAPAVDATPAVTTTTPADDATGVAVDADIIVNFSEAVGATAASFTILCAGTDQPEAVTASNANATYTLNPTGFLPYNTNCVVTVVAAQVSDQDEADPPNTMEADYAFDFTTATPTTRIHDIQGNGLLSPLEGSLITNIQGIVVAARSNGFYMQEPDAEVDADPATSEGIFVFTGSSPGVTVGDRVAVAGTVVEFRPGGASSANLTITEISNPGRAVSRLSSGNPLPTPATLAPPTESIPAGIDYYESLEGMRVQINSAVAVGPTNDFGEIPVLADNGAGAGTRTVRGGIVIQPGDFNPERVILDDAIIGNANMPKVSVGTTFPGPLLGVMDYDFGNFKFLVTTNPVATNTAATVTKETTPLIVGQNQFTVATFNVENLHPGNPQSKFNALAGIIINNLRSPDIIAVEEVQDNNGATNDSVVDATATYNTLIAAIGGLGGPTYQFAQINPSDDQDGGEPGGNIRVGFLYRTDRGISFVARPGGTATATVAVVAGASGPELSFSPGRIDPTNIAFNSSRKPLAGEFMFNGHKLFVIGNHFNSKGGDQPLFGRFQPPVLSSEEQRVQQAQIVRAFVDDILALDPDANVVVLGDLNDFQFSTPLTILEGSGATQLHTLIETLPLNEQYSYVFDGNSQALDHIMVSPNLFDNARCGYDIVHVNAEFSPQDSDHDPQLACLTLTALTPPTAGSFDAPGTEDTSQVITLRGTAANGGDLTYAIVSDPSNGTLNGLNPATGAVNYMPNANYTGPDSFTYKVTEDGVDSTIATVTITVAPENDAPVASGGNATAGEDTSIEVILVATDVENDPLTFTIVAQPMHGTLSTPVGNKVTYTPAPNYTGPDSFTFKANDGTVDSNTAEYTLTVGAKNDPPVAGNGTVATPANIAIPVTLAATDPEDSPLTYSIVTAPAHGTLGAIVGNQVTYTPTAGYSGPDTFTFRASDGTSNSNVATISITVVPPPPPPTFALTVTTTGSGTVTPDGGQYTANDTVTLTATANAGSTFIGWTVDGAFAGLANPLTITMGSAHTVTAAFATTPSFSDVAGTPYEDAILALAAYGAIFGYVDGSFGPDDNVTRAQMAALIVRAMNWDGVDHGNPFTDRGGLDEELWRSVGTLAFYGVAYGYGGGVFGPNDDVQYLQSISFITRAMITKGYWVRAQADDPTIYPNVPATSPHRLDLVTYVQHAGTLPGFAPNSSPTSLQQPATRGWYAAALLRALESRFATTP